MTMRAGRSDRNFGFGIDTLLRDHADWISGARIGLVCHPASVGVSGIHSSVLLHGRRDVRLRCLLGPEHGVTGLGGAGESIRPARHPSWRIPIHSLYSHTRKPTPAMLRGVDVIVFDLQDLGARCYTYVSTLRYVLEAAAEQRKRVIVCDRPSPLAEVVDGPMLRPRFQSFVGLIPSPVVYGMTSGEAALWLTRRFRLNVDLQIAAMTGYRRGTYQGRRWIPPSPAIKSWDCALCFPITVFFEALPALDHGRGTQTPFQRVGAPWLENRETCARLRAMRLPGVAFKPCRYLARVGEYRDRMVNGIRIEVRHAGVYRPVLTGASIISAVQQIHGIAAVWKHAGSRPEFFDKLVGTDAVRRSLLRNEDPAGLGKTWEERSRAFRQARRGLLLYPE